NQGAALYLRIVLAAGVRRGPAGSLPALQSPELRPLVERNDQIHLSIGMAVKLPAQHFAIVLVLEALRVRTVHVDGRDTEMHGLGRRLSDAAAPIIRSVHFLIGGPSFLDTELDQAGEILIERASLAIFSVQPLLHLGAGRHVLHFPEEGNAALDQLFAVSHGRLPGCCKTFASAALQEAEVKV